MSVECHVLGSKPAAKITWTRGKHQIDNLSQQQPALDQNDSPNDQHNYISEFNSDTSSTSNNNNNKNSTKQVSYLTLIPQLSDNQQSLTCSGQNPKMSSPNTLSDSIIMNVLCKYLELTRQNLPQLLP